MEQYVSSIQIKTTVFKKKIFRDNVVKLVNGAKCNFYYAILSKITEWKKME